MDKLCVVERHGERERRGEVGCRIEGLVENNIYHMINPNHNSG